MQQLPNDSLNKIMRGAGIAVLGLFSGLLLQFGARIVIARYSGEVDYGVFSLALAILNFAVVLATLGFQDGIPRNIAHFIAKGDYPHVKSSINLSIWLVSLISIVLGILLFALSGTISNTIFKIAGLETPLKLFALGIPLLAMINVVTAVFRGFGRVGPHSFFQLFLVNMAFLVLLVLVATINLPFVYVVYAYLGALLISLAGLLTYFFRESPGLAGRFKAGFDIRLSANLLAFSLPLMGTVILTVLITWADTLFVGYFKSAQAAGLYNAATPIAQLIYYPLSAWLLIYIPVATSLCAVERFEEVRRNYAIVTKWIVSTTMPLFLVVCFFPEAVINLLFGTSYAAAAPALRILSIGFIINSLFGLRWATLVALGKTKFVFWANFIAALAGVTLNITLIPILGIMGAAISSAAALSVSSVVMAIKVYRICGAQPFSMNLIKPMLLSLALALIFRFAFSHLAVILWWMLVLLFVLYCLVYGLAVLLTRSFDREDIDILLGIEKSMGLNLSLMKKFLKRFV